MINKTQRQQLALVHQQQGRLSQLSDRALCSETDRLRESVFRESDLKHEQLVGDCLALANEAVRRVLGWTLYDVQLLAATALTGRNIAEMQTGEGKTISALPAAVYGGILGRGVHVATPNVYLAERDFEQLRPVYELLGVSVGLVGGDQPEADKSDAYRRDVTYGPGYEFGFDYLRDQRFLKQRQQRPPGTRILEAIEGLNVDGPSQRGLGMVIVDEADNVLIDDATSPQILSEFQPGEAADAEAVLLARIVATTLESPLHYVETPDQNIRLTEEGIQFIHATGLNIPVAQLMRPWANYVESAIRARLHFHRDVHYVVREDQVKIVEQSTGRIFDDRSWQSGLHQAVEAKEGVTITPESLPLARITRQRFFGLYRHLTGMTGTVGSCGREFKSVYGLNVETIPLRNASARQVLPLRLFSSQPQKWDAIAKSVLDLHRRRRPVLIGTRTILDSNLLAARLDEFGLEYQLLNGIQDADEAGVVALAGREAAITIATNLAGRGTDIRLGRGVADRGGLHVIVSECHDSYRADRQLIGRCARQGDPGSCQTFVASDDWLFQQHAPWFAEALAKSIAGRSNRTGEFDFPVENQIRAIQRKLERQRFSMRMQMLAAERRRNKMLEGVR